MQFEEWRDSREGRAFALNAMTGVQFQPSPLGVIPELRGRSVAYK